MRALIDRKHSAMSKLVLIGLLLSMLISLPAIAEFPLEMTPGGIQFRELIKGEGAVVKSGDVAKIHLVMWINKQGRKGTELYNSRGDREAVSFVVGSKYMMPALNEGVLGMKPGGKRILLVPPKFAYGKKGLEGVIPPETNLIILVDLLSIEAPE